MLVLVLRSLGYETIEARTEPKASKKALFDNPNLIVIDMSLPDMTGVDAARAIKKRIQAPCACLSFAYSAWSTRTWMEQAASAGIAAYLIKPVLMALMKETIEKFILA